MCSICRGHGGGWGKVFVLGEEAKGPAGVSTDWVRDGILAPYSEACSAANESALVSLAPDVGSVLRYSWWRPVLLSPVESSVNVFMDSSTHACIRVFIPSINAELLLGSGAVVGPGLWGYHSEAETMDSPMVETGIKEVITQIRA